jgi:hypothetical protein
VSEPLSFDAEGTLQEEVDVKWMRGTAPHLSDDTNFAYLTEPEPTRSNRVRRLLGLREKERVVAILDLRNPAAKWERVV